VAGSSRHSRYRKKENMPSSHVVKLQEGGRSLPELDGSQITPFRMNEHERQRAEHNELNAISMPTVNTSRDGCGD
jgi:hypothetical protein